MCMFMVMSPVKSEEVKNEVERNKYPPLKNHVLVIK